MSDSNINMNISGSINNSTIIGQLDNLVVNYNNQDKNALEVLREHISNQPSEIIDRFNQFEEERRRQNPNKGKLISFLDDFKNIFKGVGSCMEAINSISAIVEQMV